MTLQDNPKMVQAQKEGKAPLHLIPWEPLREVAFVMETGADKYGRGNWRLDPIRASTYVAAIARHALMQWAQGESIDRDSGRHHLAHVIACCLIVLDSEAQGTLIDDRLAFESKTPPVLRGDQT